VVRIVEHQSQSGLVYRRPVEHLQSAQLEMGASSLDICDGEGLSE
jgi:hypothetical protein